MISSPNLQLIWNGVAFIVVNHTQNLSPENFGINAMNDLSGHMLSAQE